MTIASALTALNTDIVNARTAITTKGGTVTSGGGSSQLATDIATIPTGGGTPTSIDPINYVDDIYSLAYPYDATKQETAKLVYGVNPSASQGSNILKLDFNNAELVIWGSAAAQNCPNVSSLNLSSMKYLYLTSSALLSGSSSYQWSGISGVVEMPELVYISSIYGISSFSLFNYCPNITKIIAKKLRYISTATNYTTAYTNCAFANYLPSLKYVNLENYIGQTNGELKGYIISYGVGNLECMIVGNVSTISAQMIVNESHPNLTTLVFKTNQVPTLSVSSYLFGNTANNPHFNTSGSNDGSIYVPDALVNDFKVATNWSTWASYIKPISQFNNTWES